MSKKTVYDVGIVVKRSTMHVLASSAQEALRIAEEYLDDWYLDSYDEFEEDEDPYVDDCSENIYIETEEDDPLYGSNKYETLGEYMNSDDDEDEEEDEFEDPNQLSMDFE